MTRTEFEEQAKAVFADARILIFAGCRRNSTTATHTVVYMESEAADMDIEITGDGPQALAAALAAVKAAAGGEA